MQSFHPVKALASLSCQQELLPDHTSVAAHLMTSYQRDREIGPYKHQVLLVLIKLINEFSLSYLPHKDIQ